VNPKNARKPPSNWHAVAVVLHSSSCAAAALCRNKKYLAKDAPRLPMPSCENPDNCKCTFRHYLDRRESARRSYELGIVSIDLQSTEQRTKKGRRIQD
jgi:hypothetical protein